jgi:hypothetical protein
VIVDRQASRLLGSFESAQLLTSKRFALNLVVVLRLAGAPARKVLRRALDELQCRHPMLRARIVGPTASARFELAGAPSIPLRWLGRRRAGQWRPLVENELTTGFDEETGPLARCTCLAVPDGSASDLVLTFHHVIVDGVAAGTLVKELLAICGGVRSPDGASKRASSLPPSADERFPGAFKAPRVWPASARFVAGQLASEIGYRRRASPNPPPGGPFRCQISTLDLKEAESGSLVRTSRRARIGINSLCNAAMLLAVVRRRHPAGERPRRYFAFPLLRPYLKPPIQAGTVASYFTILRLTADLSADSDPLRLAADIHRQVDEAAKRGERFLACRWSVLSMRALLSQASERMGTLALNYAGAVPWPLVEDGPVVRELRAFVTNFPFGPEYTAQLRMFRGRLCWDIVSLDVDMDREEALAIAEETRRILADMTAQSEVGSR